MQFEREFDVASLGLSSELSQIYTENPHIRQVFANQQTFLRPSHLLCTSDRVVTEDTPTTKYMRRTGEAKTVLHLGQRKLLTSEIEFLSLYCNPGDHVVYAGAAPGTHINFLSEMLFPSLTFDLVDPAKFDATETDRIRIFREFFNDAIASKYCGGNQDVIFISDIRGSMNLVTPIFSPMHNKSRECLVMI